jgi:hypothetical protein
VKTPFFEGGYETPSEGLALFAMLGAGFLAHQAIARS